jgi:uncharacterized protein
MTTMAMFPLGTVLVPGGVLPLHIFEPRYRQMVKDCMAGDAEFGVTLITRGNEVGGGELRTDVGTVAKIAEIAELDDGRYALIAVGVRRITVSSWLPDDPYPRADVEEWPDVDEQDGASATGDDDLSVAVDGAMTQLRRVLALASEAGDDVSPATTEVSDDPVLATYHASALAPVGPADRYRLLAAPGPRRRVAILRELLGDAEEILRFRLAGEG